MKPGILYGNAMHYVFGVCFAMQVGWLHAIGGLMGTMLVIAAGCLANNHLDRRIDARMKRTQKRLFVRAPLSLRDITLLVASIGISGIILLHISGGELVALLGVIAFVWYVWIYGWAKRATVHSTLIGTVPGALPGVAGYLCAGQGVDGVAVMIFLVLVMWQLPHFYAIALFRKNDYERAELPTLASAVSLKMMYWVMGGCIALFVVFVTMLGYVSSIQVWAVVGLVAMGCWWLVRMIVSYHRSKPERWARGVFGGSLIVTLGMMVIMITSLGLRIGAGI